jgi:16S rRNA (guanine1207-N2)-methyltransferase
MITTVIRDKELRFITRDRLFSPKNIDRGTLAMLSVIEFNEADQICDLGCGYGVVGIVAGKMIGADRVVMVDQDEEAVKAAIENAELNDLASLDIRVSDGFANVSQADFTKIISHPPYHVDFAVPKMFIEKGFNRLRVGGQLYMVTKRKDWYKNKLIAVFGGVKIWEIDEYFVFMAVKKSGSYANAKPRKKS